MNTDQSTMGGGNLIMLSTKSPLSDIIRTTLRAQLIQTELVIYTKYVEQLLLLFELIKDILNQLQAPLNNL